MDLEAQLKAAEARRADLERQHADALNALAGCGPDALEQRQSRVRELEKKVALETVRCEELQLELSASNRGRSVGAAQSCGHHWPSAVKGTEIEKIMAKIEQDNRILAELDHSRSTTLGAGLATSASSHALGECSPPVSPIAMSHTTPSLYPSAVGAGVGGLSGYGASGTTNITGGSYLPSNSVSVGGYSSQYNSLGHHYTNKSNLIGTTMNSLGHHQHQLGMTSTGLGQTSILDKLTQQLTTSMNPSGLTGTISSIVPSSYAPVSSTTFSSGARPSAYQTSGVGGTPFATPSMNQYGLGYGASALNAIAGAGMSNAATTTYGNAVTFSNPLSSQFNSLPMSIKLKPMEEVDLDGMESEWSGGALHPADRYLNGQGAAQEGQVDMLDIPGKGRCSVYIARFSYEPEPECQEEELSLLVGDYLLVWGEPVGPAGGYLDAETLDGRRGLVPSHFVQRLIGDDLLEFHQAVLSTLREEEINQENFAADVARLNEIAEMSEAHEPEDGPEGEAVPAPRNLTLERQLNKSVLISWTAPDASGPNHIESYHVYVDGVLKATVKATERTRALVEGVDSNRPHRISVRSVTANRRTSRDAACTMIIGRDTHSLGPSAVKASNITSTSAVISWLPANSNHQHVVCVNNVEVRTVKPGVYRHTITGLAPNTQYRVTVRAKHHRAIQNVANLAEELPMPAAAHTDFRTLPKGLPDPPSDILVEPGPQDGTLLVTWHPITTPHHPGSVITGYAVYADGKKVTDVDSPTGDHALIDITKLLGLNPRHVTVRTKARDSQSADSVPTPIPLSVLRGRGGQQQRQQPHTAVMPAHLRQQQGVGRQQQQGQQVIEPDENLSDKEIFPNYRQQGGIPAIEITKENYEGNLSEDELADRGRPRQYGGQQPQTGRQQQQQQQQQAQQQQQQHRQAQQQQQQQREQQLQQLQQAQQASQQQYYQQAQQAIQKASGPAPPNQQQMRQVGGARGGPSVGGPPNPAGGPPNPQKRARWFVALFDYDPATMSPNPDACDEELPFSEGDTIKVWGDKDADGFYWGECRGKRGYVPHNMVMEVEGNQNRDRWGDIYSNTPVRRMVALYDYDPQELSPNVDAEVELSFHSGQIISVYGEMDDDGFYMGEIDGVRGLVPSNFLTDAPAGDQYGGAAAAGAAAGGAAGAGPAQRGGRAARGAGPGARGPPPPPRDATARTGGARSKDACATNLLYTSQLDSQFNQTTTQSMTSTPMNTHQEHQQARQRGMQRAGGNALAQPQQPPPAQQQPQQQQQQQQQQSTMGGFLSSLTGGGASAAAAPPPVQSQAYGASRLQHKGVPQVVPTVGGQQLQQHQQHQQQQANAAAGQQGPNIMQKINEIAAPGGDILSKGKELIFMKFGLGGK